MRKQAIHAEPTTEQRLASQYRAVVDDAQELLRTTGDYSGKRAAAARARFARKLEQWKDLLAHQQSMAVEKGQRAATATGVYVRRNPWKVLSIGLFAGVLIGFLRAKR